MDEKLSEAIKAVRMLGEQQTGAGFAPPEQRAFGEKLLTVCAAAARAAAAEQAYNESEHQLTQSALRCAAAERELEGLRRELQAYREQYAQPHHAARSSEGSSE